MALLGEVLEYGDTGFQIRLSSSKYQMPFHATDPQGRLVAASVDLATAKYAVEQMAAERDEFVLLKPEQDVLDRIRRRRG